jgi:hypothetical protein
MNKVKISFDTELEDLAQECNAYMKIKDFMSKRIIELENEVDHLKLELSGQVVKNVELYEWLKNINENMSRINCEKHEKKKNSEDDELNFSGEFVESMNIHEDINKEIKDDTKRDFLQLKNENIELIKQNELLRNGLLHKDITINRISTDKFIILNELNELVSSLSRIDLKLLNEFYQNNVDLKANKIPLPTVMGIRYNIMSALSTLGTLYEEKQINTEEVKHLNNVNFSNKIFKFYQEEFEKALNENLKKRKILANE